MPVLYELAIFIQDEFLEAYFESLGYPADNTLVVEFKDSTNAQQQIFQAQMGYRRLFDEEQHTCGICHRD